MGTKAKITKSGKVQVTMPLLAFQAINEILSHVRLGSDSEMKDAISNYLIDLEDFSDSLCKSIHCVNNKVYVSVTTNTASDDWLIEIKPDAVEAKLN